MKQVLILFLVAGFFFGFAATLTGPKSKKAYESSDNFDFLYGQWEVLNSQSLQSRQPTSLEDKNLGFFFSNKLYLESNASRANFKCQSGVEFHKFSSSEHDGFVKKSRSLPLLKSYFSKKNRDGIWSGEVICIATRQSLWSGVMLSRRQLFLVSQTDVVELYRNSRAVPLRESFSDSDQEISTE